MIPHFYSRFFCILWCSATFTTYRPLKVKVYVLQSRILQIIISWKHFSIFLYFLLVFAHYTFLGHVSLSLLLQHNSKLSALLHVSMFYSFSTFVDYLSLPSTSPLIVVSLRYDSHLRKQCLSMVRFLLFYKM